jgi:hypothetical protein
LDRVLLDKPSPLFERIVSRLLVQFAGAARNVRLIDLLGSIAWLDFFNGYGEMPATPEQVWRAIRAEAMWRWREAKGS